MESIAKFLNSISREEWATFQGYGFFFLVLFLVIVLYAYWFHLCRREKLGERNYEKYADLALKDDINDTVLEKK